MLVSQGLADIKVEGLPAAVPLSLFMLAIAVSGERKSACDTLALRARGRGRGSAADRVRGGGASVQSGLGRLRG